MFLAFHLLEFRLPAATSDLQTSATDDAGGNVWSISTAEIV